MPAPNLARGIAGGLTEPDEYELLRHLNVPGTTPFRPAWTQGIRPPRFTPRSVPVARPTTSTLATPVSRAYPWLQPVPPLHLPLLDLRPPATVPQIDPLPASGGALGELLDFEQHMRQSAIATLEAATVPRPSTVQLPMTAAAVAGALRRGAKLVWENRKAIVRYGSKVLGPVNALGTAWDVYQFLNWAAGKLPTSIPLPESWYEPAPNLIFIRWPDGTVVTSPAWPPR